MGLPLQIIGGILAAVGAILGLIVVLDVVAETSPDLLREMRQWWDGFGYTPDGGLGGRLKNALGFVIFVGPGLALFSLGGAIKKRSPPQS